MDTKPYLLRLYKEFPDMKDKSVRVPVQGMDHVAIIIGEEWVFRFPVRPEYVKAFPNEVCVLGLLQEHVTLPIPQYELIPEDASYGAYRMIRGNELTAELFKTLPPDVQAHIGTQIAEFLSQLHSVPVKDMQELYVAKNDAKADLAAFQQRYAMILAPKITAEERQLCVNVIHESRASLHWDHKKVFIHGDFSWWHLLLSADAGELAGVIDFGDKAIGDAAQDFAGLFAYGIDFVQSVYAQYTGPKDGQFLPRALLGFQRLGMSELMHALKGEFGTVEQAYPFFRQTLEAKL